MLAEVLNIQLRTKDFVDTSHQGKLPIPTANTKIILEKAKELIQEMYHEGIPIRLIGVRVDHLKEKEEEQISLFQQTKQNTKQEKLDKTIDQLKEKYGYHLITRAGNLEVENMIQFRKEKE